MSLSRSSEHNNLNNFDKNHFIIFYLDSLSSINITNRGDVLVNTKFDKLTIRGIGGEEFCNESGRFKDKFDGLRFHLLKTCHFNIVGLTKLEEHYNVVKHNRSFVCTSKLNPTDVLIFDKICSD